MPSKRPLGNCGTQLVPPRPRSKSTGLVYSLVGQLSSSQWAFISEYTLLLIPFPFYKQLGNSKKKKNTAGILTSIVNVEITTSWGHQKWHQYDAGCGKDMRVNLMGLTEKGPQSWALLQPCPKRPREELKERRCLVLTENLS